MKRALLPSNALLIPHEPQWKLAFGVALLFLTLVLALGPVLYWRFEAWALCVVTALTFIFGGLFVFVIRWRKGMTVAILLEKPARVVLIRSDGTRTLIDTAGYSHVMTRLADSELTTTELQLVGRKGRLILAASHVERGDGTFLSNPTNKPNCVLQGYRGLISQHTGLIDGGHSTLY